MSNDHTSTPDTTEATFTGADLARVALQAARAAAKSRPPGTGRPKKRRTLVRRDDSREPAKVGVVLPGLVAARAWELPTAGGTVIDRWAEIAPELARGGNVMPVSFDAEKRILALRPANNAFGTQLRLLGGQLIARINKAMGSTVVKELRVLPLGSRAVSTPAGSVPARRVDAGAADAGRTPRMPEPTAPEEFHLLRKQMQAARLERMEPAEPDRELRERYFAGAYTRGPEIEIDEEAEAAAARARRDAETRQAAIRRAREERAAQARAPSRAFGTTA